MKKPYLNIPRGTVRLPLRQTPYALGTTAGSAGAGLRGMPYGPGERQAAYIQGYLDTLQSAVWAEQATEKPAFLRQNVVAG